MHPHPVVSPSTCEALPAAGCPVSPQSSVWPSCVQNHSVLSRCCSAGIRCWQMLSGVCGGLRFSMRTLRAEQGFVNLHSCQLMWVCVVFLLSRCWLFFLFLTSSVFTAPPSPSNDWIRAVTLRWDKPRIGNGKWRDIFACFWHWFYFNYIFL